MMNLEELLSGVQMVTWDLEKCRYCGKMQENSSHQQTTTSISTTSALPRCNRCHLSAYCNRDCHRPSLALP